ncbi:hypothetical protein NM208_g835 [Fusarium decemcellulare]|uniref:Uncharacterized protein n=1 Tax=Fusarium decemcellulare TaxID=57161 RepID=A0ACC1SY55_9HYPO|nr:hypothetical protein NM208_g835 [Fusarium decemcellulare]
MAKLKRQPRALTGRDSSVEQPSPAMSPQSDRRRTLSDAQVAEGMGMKQSKRAVTAARFIHTATGEWPWEFAADFKPHAWSINMVEHLSQLTRHVKTDVGGFEPVKLFFRSVIHQKRIDEKPNQNLKAGDVIDAMVRFKVPNKTRAKAEGRARKTKAKKQINSREEEESELEKDDGDLGDVEQDESDVEEREEDEGNKVSAKTNQKNEMDEDSNEETEGNEHQENDTDALVPRRHKSLDKVVPAPQLQSTPVKTTNKADKKRTAGSHASEISKRRRIQEQEAPASPVSQVFMNENEASRPSHHFGVDPSYLQQSQPVGIEPGTFEYLGDAFKKWQSVVEEKALEVAAQREEIKRSLESHSKEMQQQEHQREQAQAQLDGYCKAVEQVLGEAKNLKEQHGRFQIQKLQMGLTPAFIVQIESHHKSERDANDKALADAMLEQQAAEEILEKHTVVPSEEAQVQEERLKLDQAKWDSKAWELEVQSERLKMMAQILRLSSAEVGALKNILSQKGLPWGEMIELSKERAVNGHNADPVGVAQGRRDLDRHG